jgi:hypothetical protein
MAIHGQPSMAMAIHGQPSMAMAMARKQEKRNFGAN